MGISMNEQRGQKLVFVIMINVGACYIEKKMNYVSISTYDNVNRSFFSRYYNYCEMRKTEKLSMLTAKKRFFFYQK